MSLLHTLDLTLFRHINGLWTHPLADHFFSFISNFGLLKLPLAAFVIGLLLWGGYRERLLLVLLALCLLIGDAGFDWAIKISANRPRPFQALENVRHVRPEGWGYRVEMTSYEPWKTGHSMPSGHTCNNVALAFLLTRLYGRRAAPWAWLWAALMAYSRIYTGDHYPSDILVSVLLATAYTAGICCAADKLWQKWGGRLAPGLYARHSTLFPCT